MARSYKMGRRMKTYDIIRTVVATRQASLFTRRLDNVARIHAFLFAFETIDEY